MAKVTVNSVQLNASIPKQQGGSYNATIINYTDLATGQADTKRVTQSILASPQGQALFNKLQQLAASPLPANVTLLFKNNVTDKGTFNNLVDVLDINSPDTSDAAPPKKAYTPGGFSGGNKSSYSGGGNKNYSDNVGMKDVLISRQVAIKAAVELGIKDPAQMFAMADKIVEYIVKPMNVDVLGKSTLQAAAPAPVAQPAFTATPTQPDQPQATATNGAATFYG